MSAELSPNFDFGKLRFREEAIREIGPDDFQGTIERLPQIYQLLEERKLDQAARAIEYLPYRLFWPAKLINNLVALTDEGKLPACLRVMERMDRLETGYGYPPGDKFTLWTASDEQILHGLAAIKTVADTFETGGSLEIKDRFSTSDVEVAFRVAVCYVGVLRAEMHFTEGTADFPQAAYNHNLNHLVTQTLQAAFALLGNFPKGLNN